MCRLAVILALAFWASSAKASGEEYIPVMPLCYTKSLIGKTVRFSLENGHTIEEAMELTNASVNGDVCFPSAKIHPDKTFCTFSARKLISRGPVEKIVVEGIPFVLFAYQMVGDACFVWSKSRGGFVSTVGRISFPGVVVFSAAPQDALKAQPVVKADEI